MTIDEAIKCAAACAREEMGKWRMVERIESEAMNIFDEFYAEDADCNIVEEIVQKIWDATI